MSTDRPNVEGIYRLSPTQEGLLFHALQAPDSGVYFQQFTCVLHGALEAADFQAAWQAALERHSALRALFTWEGRTNPLQVVRRNVVLPFDLRDDPELAGDGERLEAHLAEDRRRGFRLDQAPLMRVLLVRAGAREHRLVWSFHHLILDGWSMRLFLDEVLETYAARRRGEPPQLRPARDFQDYIAWLQAQDGDAATAFWRQVLAGFESPTELRLPRPTGTPDSGFGEHVALLSEETTRRLKSAARAERVTLNTMLRGAWALVLGAYSGEDDVVFGATVAGRPPELEGVETMVGMFINTVPVRARIPPSERSVADWLRELQGQQLDASEFETAPLVEVQRCSDLPPGQPLFETILVFENHPVQVAVRSGPGALELRAPRFVERSNYPLALLVVPGERFGLTLVHDTSRFERRAVERLAENLRTVLEGIAADPRRALGELPLQAPAERERLASFACGPGVEPPQSSVLELFQEACRHRPEATAVRQGGRTTTYAELNERARSLACELRDRGVSAESRVALCLERSPEMVVGILAALESGGAYVPLDPEWPAERLSGLLRETGAAAVLTTRSLRARLPDGGPPVICLDEPRAAEPSRPAGELALPSGEHLAYVIFTSGSTGRPKGVEVTHHSLLLSTAARFEHYRHPPASYLLLSPYHFDSSVAGLFWTLGSGAALVLPPPGGERDVRGLAELVAREGVTHTLCLPSLYELLLEVAEPGELGSLKTVVVAGEACPGSLVAAHREALPGADLVNEYGPTEATVWATAHFAGDADTDAAVPIGRPVGPTEVYLLDARGKPVPLGVPGEVFLGGGGLARGYQAQPEATAERFVERRPFGGAPRRLYRTGDRARFREDGALEFLGRVDDQVKVRGQRIELGEIEARLAAFPTVREAVVVARSDPRRRTTGLVAYVVPAAGARADSLAQELRGLLAQSLPQAMVPSDFVTLEALPRTSTGKLDRKALPTPERTASPAPLEPVPPRNAAERKLSAIWREVLGLEEISTDANFFELGGDSLLSIRIIARAHQAGLRVDPARFAERPTVAGMAAAARDASPAPEVDQSPGPVPLTPIQHWFFGLELPEPHHWNQAVLLELPADAEPRHVEPALQALVAGHDALRLRFLQDGSGWSQEVAAEFPLSLEVHDLSRFPEGDRPSELERLASVLQAGFELSSSGLLRAAFFRWSAAGPSRLLIAVHHLAIDAVSWGVLLEDLHTAYDQLRRGASIALPAGGASFAQWARRLESYAGSTAIEVEIPHWCRLEDVREAALPLDLEDGRECNAVTTERSVTAALDERRTRALLQDVPAVYGTRIQDLLLTALLRALQGWTGQPALYFDLEGHGREPHLAELDVSRTVGWLTAVWPVELSLPIGTAAGDAIKSVKEQLRSIPGGGVGFGLLRDLRGEAALRDRLTRLPRRDLLFNYLGRREVGGERTFPPAREGVGQSRSPLGERAYLIEINAVCEEQVLSARWTFSSAVHHAETIELLARGFVEELGALVDHCLSPEAGGRTPSDFPLADLDQAQLDKLADLLGED